MTLRAQQPQGKDAKGQFIERFLANGGTVTDVRAA